MDAVERAKSGHPGMPMGMADVATVLFAEHLKYDPAHPHWPDRDRFVLSAGHGSMLIYALLYLTGYADMGIEDLKQFRQLHAKTAGHPEYGHASGIETTTGPLGQGIANAVGMALAERLLQAQFGDALVGHYTYVIAGDGCLMEGISQEAISFAGHLNLSKLIVLWDDNRISIDGPISLSSSEDMAMRFTAAGWAVDAVDGHDMDAVSTALTKARSNDKPTLIACRTTIAYGAPTKAGSEKSHGSPLGAEEIAGTRAALNWPHAPFEIPTEILAQWRAWGARGAADYTRWTERLNAAPEAVQGEFTRRMEGELPDGWQEAMAALKTRWVSEKPLLATRASSAQVLEVLTDAIPELIGGSADLTSSNLTKTKALAPVTRNDFSGRYLYYGIREHGMAAAMNGLALHGGVIPFGGTFLVFSDYCKPAIRLSALMQQRVIYVFTHDSIGVGEDGPTHQPVEHLAMLRSIPSLTVFRPADAVETAECWELALSHSGPSVLALTRQNLPALRDSASGNPCARGGYVLHDATNAKATLIATGSEVSLAVAAAETLSTEHGVAVRVVSLPSWELFAAQPTSYRQEVLGSAPRIGIEAASPMGWERFLGDTGTFIGMQGFGASGPADQVYAHCGITKEAVVKAVLSVK
jgi:transketolase